VTELRMNEPTIKENNTVVMAGLELPGSADFDHSMDEMVSLIEACDLEVVATLTQRLPHPETATYLGRGKVEELARLIKAMEAGYCIFEGNLTPAQLKNLTRMVEVPIWDRTTLILEIFSRRARTGEARLQVESAYLQYILPRLSGMWQHLGRQSGGSGSRANRGIGETQLELDRRQIKKRIAELSGELEIVSRTRSIQRSGRIRSGLPQVAIVGYTNAGKSTLLNKMIDFAGGNQEKKVETKDMLFATLDTSIRHIKTEGNKDFLLSDTVGFIENLPHGLVKAFHSTLEEAMNADLLLIVLDASDAHHRRHLKVTEETLRSLGADKIPKIYVMNKADLIEDSGFSIPCIRGDEIWMSAATGQGLAELLMMITGKVYADSEVITLMLPFARGDIVSRLHTQANVLSEKYTEQGIFIRADCPKSLAGEFGRFLA
jgi:GTP-binding protein HflX